MRRHNQNAPFNSSQESRSEIVNSPTSEPLKLCTKVSPFLFQIPGDAGTRKPDFSGSFSFSFSLGSPIGSFLAPLFLKENFFLGNNSALKFSRLCLKSETALSEDRTSYEGKKYEFSATSFSRSEMEDEI